MKIRAFVFFIFVKEKHFRGGQRRPIYSANGRTGGTIAEMVTIITIDFFEKFFSCQNIYIDTKMYGSTIKKGVSVPLISKRDLKKWNKNEYLNIRETNIFPYFLLFEYSIDWKGIK